MTSVTKAKPGDRVPVTRDRVLFSAVAIADESGIDAVTMRRLADELGVGVMSLYYHVPNKDAILNGLADVIFGEIEDATKTAATTTAAADWKAAVRGRVLTAREVLLRHPWAPALIESRDAIGLAQARYIDSIVGIMHEGGFDSDLIHHGLHALGSRAFGFTTEFVEPEGGASGNAAVLEQMAEHVPNLVRMLSQVRHDDETTALGWCDDQFEFEFGLDLLLDGLDRLNRVSRVSRESGAAASGGSR